MFTEEKCLLCQRTAVAALIFYLLSCTIQKFACRLSPSFLIGQSHVALLKFEVALVDLTPFLADF